MMNWYKQSKKNPMEEFSYGDDIRELWNNILFMEMDRVNIHFNTENNDGFDIRTKDLSFKHNDSEYRVTARICWAGGDWESPICYFACQFEDRMYFEHDKSWSKWSNCCKSIIIPEKNNVNLTKGKKGGLVARSAEEGKDKDEKALWDEMLAMAEKRIKGYMNEYLDYNGDIRFEHTGCARKLVDLMKSRREK